MLLMLIASAASADQPASSAEDTRAGALIRKIRIEGNSALSDEDIALIIVPYEDETLSLAQMQEVAAELQQRYHALGYATTRVVVRPQQIKDGVLRLRVLEGRVGRVFVEGSRHFSPERNYLPYTPAEGELLNLNSLRTGLRFLNSNPDINATAVLQRGREAGTTDIKLVAKEHDPFHLSLKYDNAGTPNTPLSRTYVTAQYDNLFDLSQILSFQYGTAPANPNKVQQYALSYYVPFAPLGGPPGHSITFYGGRSKSDSDVILDLFSVSGQGTVYGVNYTLPLPDLWSWRQQLSLGLEYQRIESNPGFGLANVAHTLPLQAGWGASKRHNNGVTSLSASVRYQKDGLFRDFDAQHYAASRQGADTDFLLCTLGAQRTQNIHAGWTASVAAEAQLTDDRLLPSQQYGLGGYDSVRGYRRRVLTADEALNVRTELRAPLLPRLLPARLHEQIQPLAFLDYARASNKRARAGELDTENMLGAGLGLRFSLLEGAMTGRLDAGWALKDLRSTPEREKGQCLVHIGAEWRY